MNSLGRISTRRVPLLTQLKIIFGGTLLQFGSFFFWFGLPFSLVFIMNSELVNLFKFDGDWKTTQGIIQEIEETNASVNEEPIYRYYFSYNVNGQSYQGYSSDFYKAAYDNNSVVEVPVEYKEGDVTRARIQGMRQETFSAWVGFVLLFPLIGALLFFGAMRTNLHALRLVKIGHTTRGTILRARATNTRINEQTVYEYEFAFEVNGRTHVAKTKTHLTDRVEDEETELILYNPTDPEDNVVYDNIDGLGKLDWSSNDIPNVGLRVLPNLLSTIVGLIATSAVVYAFLL